MSGEISYSYSTNGLSTRGQRIPDVPIVYVLITRGDRDFSIGGPALVDTGFDGGIYPNLPIIQYLEGLKPTKIEELEGAKGPITCEVFRISASFTKPETHEPIRAIGEINIYVPISPEALSDEAILGREILNRLEVKLDGKQTSIT